MSSMRADVSAVRRRRVLGGSLAGMAGILATGQAPVLAQAQPKKLVMAHINAVPESAAIAFAWMADEVGKRSNGELAMEFHGSTLLSKELEIMNAVKAGNIAIGNPAGAAATVFPEMGVFLVPYLVRSYDHAYKMFNGAIGDKLDQSFQDKYKLKVLCFFDYGFRHFWTTRKPIVEPRDLRGAKIRVQQAKVFGDTINGLGGNAVPMAWGEVISAAKQGVIDGGDLPIVNQLALKIYEVSKYCSMTFHNYGPTVNVMNLEIWNGLADAHKKLMLDLSREAQARIRELTETVDNFDKAKELLGAKGMTVVQGNVEAFRKVAQERIWPAYKTQYGALWDEIDAVKA
ncbi:TRAP transporter substrate-binding protein [Vineibacter terrae]|uniref:TRAP transporter substrate-binding protein n=1 Tax=Vineibacter terrae TaxID=2586908 RepID=A0A5C8PK00_9HYPH|nr:TRAP transporter substrate-binding protein [Vineibacter terrae]TXL74172.1 TRAP transporter substrate-binding protein [Vineibacter terrae]